MRFNRHGLTLGLAAALALTAGARELSAQWRQAAGPEGGSINALAVHPDGLVAALPTGAIYLYDWDDARWSRRGDAMLFDVATLGRALVGTTMTGMVRSTDAGETWSEVGPIGGLLVSVDGGDGFAVDNERLYRSTDEGATWDRYAELSPNVLSVAVMDSIVVAGVDGVPAVLRTTDQGESWNLITTGLPDGGYPYELHDIGGVIYAAVRRQAPTRNLGIYRSTDGGSSWSALSEGLPISFGDNYPWVFDFNTVGGRVGIATTAGYFRLDTERWTRLTDASLTSTASGAGGTYIGTISGVRRFDSASTTWLDMNEGLRAAWIRDVIAVDGAEIAATAAGIHRSTDGGGAWTTTLDASVAQLESAGGTLLARLDPYDVDGIHRSTDLGRTWQAATEGITDERMALRTVAAGDGIFYAGLNEVNGGSGGGPEWRSGGVYRSTDLGATWTLASSGLPMQRGVPAPIVELAATGDHVVAATHAGLYYSTDRGASWQLSTFDEANGAVVALGSHEGTLLLATVGYTWRSVDGGRTWLRHGIAFERPITSFHSVGDALLAHAGYDEPGTLYRYFPGGWEEITSRLPEGVLFASAARAGSGVLLGTSGSSVWYGSLDMIAGVDDEHEHVVSARVVPNPVRTSAQLLVGLANGGDARLDIVDALGNVVAHHALGRLEAGEQAIDIDMASLPAGTYHYRLNVGSASKTGVIVKR